MNWHPLATADPVPGDPAVVRSSADDYANVATSIASARSRTRKLGLEKAESQTVAKLDEAAREIDDSLAAVATRYGEVGAALAAYATALSHAQSEARRLWREARASQESADNAQGDVTRAQRALDDAEALEAADGTPVPWAVRQRVVDATDSVTTSRANVQQRRDDLAVVVATVGKAAAAAARAVRATVKSSPINDRWFEKPWVIKVAKFVAQVADSVATAAGMVALVTAWIPVIGQAIALVALIATVVSFVSKLVLLAAGEVSWQEMAIEAALLVVSMVGGRVAGKLIGRYASRVTSAASKRASKVKTLINKVRPVAGKGKVRGGKPRIVKRGPAERYSTKRVYNPARQRQLTDYRHPWQFTRGQNGQSIGRQYVDQFRGRFAEGVRSFDGLTGGEKVLRAMGMGDEALMANAHVRKSNDMLRNRGLPELLAPGTKLNSLLQTGPVGGVLTEAGLKVLDVVSLADDVASK